MGFECGDHQPYGSDESPRFAQFSSVQSEAMFSEVALDSVEEKITLRGRQTGRHEFHYSNIGI
jgi:hypothetical protein